MSDIKNILGELAQAVDTHQRDTKTLNTLAKIASLGTSTEDVGNVIFKDMHERDWDKTVIFIDALADVTANILMRWRAAARLAYLNKNMEQ